MSAGAGVGDLASQASVVSLAAHDHKKPLSLPLFSPLSPAEPPRPPSTSTTSIPPSLSRRNSGNRLKPLESVVLPGAAAAAALQADDESVTKPKVLHCIIN